MLHSAVLREQSSFRKIANTVYKKNILYMVLAPVISRKVREITILGSCALYLGFTHLIFSNYAYRAYRFYYVFEGLDYLATYIQV